MPLTWKTLPHSPLWAIVMEIQYKNVAVYHFTLLHRALFSAFFHGLLFFLFGWSSNTGCNVPLIQTEKKERDNRENVAKMDCDKPWHIQDKKEEVLARHTEA